MEIWLRLAGGLLAAIAVGDIFLTILYTRRNAGIVTPVLTRWGWRLLKLVAPAFGPARKIVLSWSGPLLLVAIVFTWVLLLAVGFALIYWPDLGSGLTASKGPTPDDFFTALYYSGFCLSTLGVGDISPTVSHTQLLSVIEAGLGFSFFTLTITYLLSIYSALQRRNTLASVLHHKTGGTGNPVDLLLRLGSGDRLAGARNEFTDLAARVADLHESHVFYPVLYQFYFRQLRYSFPRMILILMDTASLLRTLPVPGREAVEPAVLEMQTACRELQLRLTDVLISRNRPESQTPGPAEIEQWRRHFRTAAEELKGKGVALPTDLRREEESYLALRREWAPFIASFTASLGYEMDEILP